MCSVLMPLGCTFRYKGKSTVTPPAFKPTTCSANNSVVFSGMT